jgi:hypothetical protein
MSSLIWVPRTLFLHFNRVQIAAPAAGKNSASRLFAPINIYRARPIPDNAMVEKCRSLATGVTLYGNIGARTP